jgi:SIR2-like domain
MAPPYRLIRDALRGGRVIPFLGAGASFGSRDPGAVPWGHKPAGVLDDWVVEYLPTASELAKHLAKVADFPEDPRDLATVAQYFHMVGGRSELYFTLQNIFKFQQKPGEIHQYLAEVAGTTPLLIVTTNYDDLIERAFACAGRTYDVVVHVTDASGGSEILWWKHDAPTPVDILAKDLDIELSKTSVIYKMHGAMDRTASHRDHYVITEDDYVDFLSRLAKNSAIPNIFAEPFQRRPFLFLGYGLADWNLRVVLSRIEREMRRPGDIVSWAIEARPKPLERKLWVKRGVSVYDELTLDEFVAGLRQVSP